MRTIFDVRDLEKQYKAVKARVRGALLLREWLRHSEALSLTWRVAMQTLFLHRISVVHVYLNIATTTDPVGRDLHH